MAEEPRDNGQELQGDEEKDIAKAMTNERVAETPDGQPAPDASRVAAEAEAEPVAAPALIGAETEADPAEVASSEAEAAPSEAGASTEAEAASTEDKSPAAPPAKTRPPRPPKRDGRPSRGRRPGPARPEEPRGAGPALRADIHQILEVLPERVAGELQIRPEQVRAVAGLLDEGATIPFIARYRKEMTGSLDEVVITAVRDRLERLAELEKRRDFILRSLSEREVLTPDLEQAVRAAETMAVLEDLYLPYRPKRRTRATVAREKGLEPLAERLLAQDPAEPFDPLEAAGAFVSEEKQVGSAEEALQGARDIIAERVSEDAGARGLMRGLYERRALFASRVAKGKEEQGTKYRDYFEWQEPIERAASHRVLAMLRGESEGVLSLRVAPEEAEALNLLVPLFVKGEGPVSEQVRLAVEDGYRRLMGPSLETEARAAAKERADAEAIRVFVGNLRELLLSPPLGEKRVMAIDPGFRTGCKLAVLDNQGTLLHHETIYPHASSDAKREEAGGRVRELLTAHGVEVVAVGNGTAGRETEDFLRGLELPSSVPVVSVNEAGASVYSASEVARGELPDQDVTVRGAVSIGRRLMDPLAELVKIDPKAIGVGQYQHDVDQGALRRSLDETVESVVDSVGVEVNTASRQLLTYVSGLGPSLAGNIVAHREQQGPFKTRDDLRKVPRLGPKAFEQAAGFLRIREGEEPLDASAVHPEAYRVVYRMASDLGVEVAELMRRSELREQIELDKYVDDQIGMPTLNDILAELAKPGRDPRGSFEPFSFAAGVEKIEDLQPGMKLPGIVSNVTAFGAFVDVGVHQDGLVHVSQLADRFVRDPAEVVKVGQRVNVTVLEVDQERNRISLSMRERPEEQREGGRARAAQGAEEAAAGPSRAARGEQRAPVGAGAPSRGPRGEGAARGGSERGRGAGPGAGRGGRREGPGGRGERPGGPRRPGRGRGPREDRQPTTIRSGEGTGFTIGERLKDVFRELTGSPAPEENAPASAAEKPAAANPGAGVESPPQPQVPDERPADDAGPGSVEGTPPAKDAPPAEDTPPREAPPAEESERHEAPPAEEPDKD